MLTKKPDKKKDPAKKLLAKAMADHISQLLNEQEFTQKDLAKILGKTEEEVSSWIHDNQDTLSMPAKISVALEVKVIPHECKSSSTSNAPDMNALKMQLIGEILSMNDVPSLEKLVTQFQGMKR